MISRGVRGCEPSRAFSQPRRRQGFCTPWLPRFRAIRADCEQRYKTVFTKTLVPIRVSVLVQFANVLAEDAARFHAAIGVHLDFEPEHPVDLSPLLRCEGVERLRRHLGVGFEQGVPVPLKLLYDLLPAPDGRKLLLSRHAGFL